METKELQKKIVKIVNQIDTKPKIRNEEIKKEDLSDEIADVFLLLTYLANINKIDIEEAILNKTNKLKQRHNL